MAISFSKRVVDEVLGIASFTNGVILGMFLLGTLTARRTARRVRRCPTGAAVMLAVKLGTAVSWQWYVLIGSVATFAVGAVAGVYCARPRPWIRDESRRRFDRVAAIVQEAHERQLFPAAVIEVGTSDDVLWRSATGRLTYDDGAPPVTEQTVFDLASLTKPVVTASVAMRLEEAGRLRLSDQCHSLAAALARTRSIARDAS